MLSASACPTPPAPRCNSRTSGRTSPSISSKTASIFRSIFSRRHNYTVDELFAHKFDPRFREVMKEAVDRARELFLTGLPLARMVDRRLSIDLELFSRGGLCVLDKIEPAGTTTCCSRCPVSLKVERVEPGCSSTPPRMPPSRAPHDFSSPSLTRICCAASPKSVRAISITPSSCFRLSRRTPCVPSIRSCVIATTSATSPAPPAAIWKAIATLSTKRCQGRLDDHPVWPAFLDTVARYSIPQQYFHDMIEGVESDLEPRIIQTFAELYSYCYRVASVVGLTTIHIFGLHLAPTFCRSSRKSAASPSCSPTFCVT